MSVDPTLVTADYSSNDQNSYTTASMSPTASRWLVADIVTRKGTADVAAPSVSALSLSWATETGVTADGSFCHLDRFYAWTGSSPGSGTMTISYAGVTQLGCAWIIYVLGADTDTSDPFVQSVTANPVGNGTSVSPTLAAFSNAANRPLICAHHNANEASTVDSTPSAYTSISDKNGPNPNVGFAASYNAANTDTTPSYTWGTSTGFRVAIASEIQFQVAGAASAMDPFMRAGFFGA